MVAHELILGSRNIVESDKAIVNLDQLNQIKQLSQEKPNDLRSIRSEFDYSLKKSFTDVLKDPTRAQQIARLKNVQSN